jgi:peroxiredoxin
LEARGEKPMPYKARFYFGRDSIMHRSVVYFGEPPRQTSFVAILNSIRGNPEWTAAAFQFKLPASAKLDDGAEAKMLDLGKRAPDFTLPTPAGKRVSLAEISKGKKATLINFWFLGCPPCRKEFPSFEQLYEKFKAEGFAIVAINMGDSPGPVASYVRQQHLSFPVLMGGRESASPIFKDYAVASYQATYVFDSENKLVYKTSGLDLDQIRKTSANLGVR